MLNLVTDFDGTVTDVYKEAESYFEAYVQMLALEMKILEAELREKLEVARKIILESPSEYGWVSEGRIVAPATSDPYLLTQSCALMVLQGEKDSHHTPPEEEWNNLFSRLFASAYPKAGIYFRPWACEYVTTLNSRSNLTVVTNSSTTSVQRKLEKLLCDGQTVKVVGGAKKFIVDQSWNEVPEKIYIKGLDRPVYLRRKIYADVLTSLGDVDGVCGDIWELDLAIPERFGIYTALVLTDSTPSWEKSHYLHFENGIASSSLEEIADILLTA